LFALILSILRHYRSRPQQAAQFDWLHVTIHGVPDGLPKPHADIAAAQLASSFNFISTHADVDRVVTAALRWRTRAWHLRKCDATEASQAPWDAISFIWPHPFHGT
jgi:hypothetical protein